MPVTGIAADTIFRVRRRRGVFCVPSAGAAALSFFARRVRRGLACFSAGAGSGAAADGAAAGAGASVFGSQAGSAANAARVRPAARASTMVFRFLFMCVSFRFFGRGPYVPVRRTVNQKAV